MLDGLLDEQDVKGSVAEGDEAIVAGNAGKLTAVSIFDEGGQYVLADSSGAARLVDDEDAAGGVGVAKDVLDGQRVESSQVGDS